MTRHKVIRLIVRAIVNGLAAALVVLAAFTALHMFETAYVAEKQSRENTGPTSHPYQAGQDRATGELSFNEEMTDYMPVVAGILVTLGTIVIGLRRKEDGAD